MSMAVGSMVSFSDWDDSTGDPIIVTGKVESEFTDPDERYHRPSFHVRTAGGRVFTPYSDECRPAKPAELEGAAQCAEGMHSWINATGKLPANTQCTRCREFYGDPK